MKQRERGLHELYRQDPVAADWLAFGRRADPVTRRGFLGGAGRMAALLGAEVAFASLMPSGLIPAALADSDSDFVIPGKVPGLRILNDRPLNAETPAHLLDDPITPASHMFVRNNGLPPPSVDAAGWRLVIDGEAVPRPLTFTLAELKARFRARRYRLVLECGGNGRHEFNPPARGNQWTTGAVGCGEWTGLRLRELLDAAGVGDGAVYVAYHGADSHLSGDPAKEAISRGIPIAKAREDETLLAWALNGEAIPLLHGAPLRLVAGGWPASVSGKWVNRLGIRDRVHDGAKMGGQSYRVPCDPVKPGATVADDAMCIIESMPVKSLITFPRSGIDHDAGPLAIRGHAWAGDLAVARVELSIDFGQHWQPAELDPPPNRLAWQRFRGTVTFPGPGYYEVWARATDTAGRAQPMVVPGWNPRGYLNNACHRIAVRVA
jgi:DMSO/TMAO reductase YedYZ molybdopterin-dependent catalytic subunit